MSESNRNPGQDSEGAFQPITDRRSFLEGSLAGAASISFAALTARRSSAFELPYGDDYGPLSPVEDKTTGLSLLKLPKGFSYRSWGWTGQPMDDDQPTPRLHDGMSVVAAKGDRIIIVRNHEQEIFPNPPVSVLADPVRVRGRACYDPDFAAGGTTNISFDTDSGRWQSAYCSLSGTVRNCAGGRTPAEGHGLRGVGGLGDGSRHRLRLPDRGRHARRLLPVRPESLRPARARRDPLPAQGEGAGRLQLQRQGRRVARPSGRHDLGRRVGGGLGSARPQRPHLRLCAEPGNYTGQEWAGACFYDRWLFVNIQTPGITFAITGPWDNGAL